MMNPNATRCGWCGTDPLYVLYHDTEWGVPCHDERALFEAIVLDGAQAGLAWITILRKRDAYRRAFDGFDPERVARYNCRSVERLLADPGIVRNRLKIESAIGNARAVLRLRDAGRSLDEVLWGFVGGRTRRNRWRTLSRVPAETPEAEAMSRELRALGFAFVGPTICYAFMQACGLVNDHLVSCFRHGEV
ncbi:MAG: DNA-3-methyladenine glycosylase I [Acidobacteriota bacterium]